MAKFDISKKGYDTDQVDSFINKLSLKYEERLSEQKDRVFALKNELSLLKDRLDTYKDKDKQISQALIYAVEKAEQIENNASKLYDLEIKRLRLLYKQWDELLEKLLQSDLGMSCEKELIMFRQTVGEVLEQNNRMGSNIIRKDLRSNSDNYIKNLLNKMDYAINTKPKTTTSKDVVENLSTETEKENARLINLSGKLDRISVNGVGNMDAYLNADEDMSSVYARNITHGKSEPKKKKTEEFNLDDLLNPKEDLDEIMRAFDFFIENNEDKK